MDGPWSFVRAMKKTARIVIVKSATLATLQSCNGLYVAYGKAVMPQ